MRGNARPARSKFEGWRRVDENGGGMDSTASSAIVWIGGAAHSLIAVLGMSLSSPAI
jgi:hypothetical protein